MIVRISKHSKHFHYFYPSSCENVYTQDINENTCKRA